MPLALARRGLRELDRCFNVTERAYYWNRADRAGVTDSFFLLLAPEQVTFAYNTRWALETRRRGGVIGGGCCLHIFAIFVSPSGHHVTSGAVGCTCSLSF